MLANSIHCGEGTMQFTTCSAPLTAVATRPFHMFSQGPAMRLEYGPPEESKIRDLENQIGNARRKGDPVDSLVEERRRTYESWIERLGREIAAAKEARERDRLNGQRERAIRDYGQM